MLYRHSPPENVFEKKCSMIRSGTSAAAAADRIQFQMTLHEEDEENVDEKDQVGNLDPSCVPIKHIRIWGDS